MGFSLGSVSANLGELKDVWEHLYTRDWSGLIEAVKQVRQDKGNTGTLNRVENYARTAESDGKRFPDSFNGLVGMIG